jgi:hypothetical protein
MQKEGIENPAFILREFVENVISVVEKGRHYHIAGLGYFFKEGSMQFVFGETETTVNECSDDTHSSGKNKLWLITSLICLCLVVSACLLFVVFNMHSPKEQSDMFTFRTKKPNNQFVIVDKSDDCDEVNNLQAFSQAKDYHVVVACFEEKSNAEKFVFQCQKNGYDKAVILSMIGVLYPVSIDSFASYDEALSKKQEYDSRFRDNALIFKTK